MLEEEQLLAFKERIDQLMNVCSSLKEENERLKKRLESAQKELQESVQQAEAFQRKYLNLKAIKTCEATKEGNNELAKRVNRLAKEVDKCIQMLGI